MRGDVTPPSPTHHCFRFNCEPTKCLEYSSKSAAPDNRKKSSPTDKAAVDEAGKRKSQAVTFSQPVVEVPTTGPEEYKALLDQLANMKAVCDKLKQNNLRRDLDQLQTSLSKYENNTRGRWKWKWK